MLPSAAGRSRCRLPERGHVCAASCLSGWVSPRRPSGDTCDRRDRPPRPRRPDPGKQAGDYKRAAGSFPAPGLRAIWVLNSPRGVKRPGSPIPRGVGMGDPGVLAPRESQAMLQAWGFVVPIPPPPAQL